MKKIILTKIIYGIMLIILFENAIALESVLSNNKKYLYCKYSNPRLGVNRITMDGGIYWKNIKQIINPYETCSVSNVTRKGDNFNQNNIRVFPNPTNDILKLSFYSINKDRTEIKILNSLGEILYKEDYEIIQGWNFHSINIISLFEGNYILQIGFKAGSKHIIFTKVK